MFDSSLPLHIKRDAQKLAFDRTVESNNRICDTYSYKADLMAIVADSSMKAAFLMLYAVVRLKFGPGISPARLLHLWGETMKEDFKELEAGMDLITRKKS